MRQMERHSGRLHVLLLDITNEASVQQVVRYVLQHLPPGGLWALVNNAGIGGHGYIEWTSLAIYQKVQTFNQLICISQVASVNLFGTIRMTKAMLPLIRKSQGRIVNVSSTLGRQSGPFMSAYRSASKSNETFKSGSTFLLLFSLIFLGGHLVAA